VIISVAQYQCLYRPIRSNKGGDTLNDIILERKVALRARHKFVFFCCSSTHVGNSLVLFYPDGNRLEMPISGSIECIVGKPNNDVVYVVHPQLPALPGGGWAFDGRVLYVKCFAKLKKYTLYIIPRIDLDI
jgi:hypothetical protein